MALIAAAAVELLIDSVADTAARVGTPSALVRSVVIETSAPARDFILSTGPQVQLTPGVGTATPDLELPAEAFLRLVSGRLDPAHTPDGLEPSSLVADLREVFPGF